MNHDERSRNRNCIKFKQSFVQSHGLQKNHATDKKKYDNSLVNLSASYFDMTSRHLIKYKLDLGFWD